MGRDPTSASERFCMNEHEKSQTKRRIGRSEPYRWQVTDELWQRLEPLLRDPPRRFQHPGRLRYPARKCLKGILYVLFTDTPWLELPYRELELPTEQLR